MEPARVPLSRVKRIMKEDPEVIAVTNSAVQHMSSAIQVFINHFTEQALMASRAEGRNRIGYRDFAQVANENEDLAFLGPLVPKTVPFDSVREPGEIEELRNTAIPFPRREEQMEADEEDVSD